MFFIKSPKLFNFVIDKSSFACAEDRNSTVEFYANNNIALFLDLG